MGGEHYLKEELYRLMRTDDTVFEFLQIGSLDGIWYWNLERKDDEWMSPRFWEVMGYDPAEKRHSASEWQGLIFPDDLKVALDNLNRHLADANHPYDQVVRYRHRNGSTVWVRCRGVAIRTPVGTPIRMLGAHTDLTAFKRAEAELQRKSRELAAANRQLEEVMTKVKTLRSLVPICSVCKKIRDDDGYWHQIEEYIRTHTGAELSHSYCPECGNLAIGDSEPRATEG